MLPDPQVRFTVSRYRLGFSQRSLGFRAGKAGNEAYSQSERSWNVYQLPERFLFYRGSLLLDVSDTPACIWLTKGAVCCWTSMLGARQYVLLYRLDFPNGYLISVWCTRETRRT